MFVSLKRYTERGLVAALFIFSVFAGPSVAAQTAGPRTPLQVVTAEGTSHAFEVELALSNDQRSMGLMYRAELAPDHGMLFIFGDTRPRSFWMRNCLIPLDIIYLNPDGSILNIVANAEPGTDTPRRSNGPAKAVLEIPGGRAAELGIMPGDIVRHILLGNVKASDGAGH